MPRSYKFTAGPSVVRIVFRYHLRQYAWLLCCSLSRSVLCAHRCRGDDRPGRTRPEYRGGSTGVVTSDGL